MLVPFLGALYRGRVGGKWAELSIEGSAEIHLGLYSLVLWLSSLALEQISFFDITSLEL